MEIIGEYFRSFLDMCINTDDNWASWLDKHDIVLSNARYASSNDIVFSLSFPTREDQLAYELKYGCKSPRDNNGSS